MISNNPPGAPGGRAPRGRRTTRAKLLRGERQIVIPHEGREYRLPVTKNGKLLLTD